MSVGATANLLVASRELSTVWSLAHDGSGVQWTLSSQLESDFMFANPRDAFYQPHDVIELPNGNLLVIDDGTNRPGCYDRVTAECFSRAVMYALDSNAAASNASALASSRAASRARGNRTAGGVDTSSSAGAAASYHWSGAERLNRPAELVWQFEFPLQLATSSWKEVMERDVFNSCGGSVYAMRNGNYLIAFTALDSAVHTHNRSKDRTTYAWEVDFHTGNPVVRSSLLLPIPHDAAGTQNAYRMTPWESIFGESTDSPL